MACLAAMKVTTLIEHETPHGVLIQCPPFLEHFNMTLEPVS